ncbi:hypothetical protein GW17_00048355 [Ensete ventricosum]|nr:hypothetical protein GW17_00048355 [Ensete ventricosum]
MEMAATAKGSVAVEGEGDGTTQKPSPSSTAATSPLPYLLLCYHYQCPLPYSLAAAAAVATQKGSMMLLEPSLVMHNSVDAASDRHILLKGRHFYYLAYHSALHSVTIAAVVPSSTIAVASVPLPSTAPSAFYCHLLQPLPPPLPFLHRQ